MSFEELIKKWEDICARENGCNNCPFIATRGVSCQLAYWKQVITTIKAMNYPIPPIPPIEMDPNKPIDVIGR